MAVLQPANQARRSGSTPGSLKLCVCVYYSVALVQVHTNVQVMYCNTTLLAIQPQFHTGFFWLQGGGGGGGGDFFFLVIVN